MKAVRFEVVPDAHDTERHFARMRTDGKLMQLAPEVVDLPDETLVAMLAHEFGHAADHAYPGCWSWPKVGAGESVWVGGTDKERAAAWRNIFGKADARSRHANDDAEVAGRWMGAWHRRNEDQVEWTADAIAFAVTGRKIGYCGKCMLQCFSGIERPAGLR
jgi:hypothetical protein